MNYKAVKKYPKYCNIETGVCVIPVQLFEQTTDKVMDSPCEC